MGAVIVEEVDIMEVVIVEEMGIVEEEDMEIMVTTLVAIIMVLMVVVITPKEVKVVVVIIPRELSFNGNILSCVSDTTTEYKEESIFVVLALLVLILMFMQKMVQELRDVVIVSWGKLYETKTFHLNQMENSFIKEVCWCLSYRGVSIL